MMTSQYLVDETVNVLCEYDTGWHHGSASYYTIHPLTNDIVMMNNIFLANALPQSLV